MLGCCPEALSGDAAEGLVALGLVLDRKLARMFWRELGVDEMGPRGLLSFAASSSRVGGLLEGILLGLRAGSVDAIVFEDEDACGQRVIVSRLVEGWASGEDLLGLEIRERLAGRKGRGFESGGLPWGVGLSGEIGRAHV